MWIKQPDSICRLGLGTLRTETLITGDTPCVPPLVKGDALLVFFCIIPQMFRIFLVENNYVSY